MGEGGNDFFSEPTSREGAQDTCSGGPGNDVFVANNRPASRDIVTCGRGFDRVLADREDLFTPDCETSFFGITDQEFFARVPQSFFPSLAPFPE